jgi:cysteine-rich repeat protein
MHASVKLATLAAFALGGCNAILGIGDVKSSAGGADAAVVLPDVPPTTITGTSVITYVKGDGTTETRNEDMSGYTVRAWIPDSSTAGYHMVPGTGTANGTFSIADVPEGTTYALELTPPNAKPMWFVTDQRVIDAGFVTLGRADGVSTTISTPVTMNITGMTAWTTADQLYADSYAVGTENGLYYGAANPTLTGKPKVGDTALAVGVDWKSGYTYDANASPPRLVQKSAGDDFYLVHSSSQPGTDDQGDPVTFSRTIDVFKGSMVDMTDGGSTQISGAFVTTPQTQTQTFHLDLVQYRALSSDANRFYDEAYSCYRLTNPGVAYDGRIGSAIWGVNGDLLQRQTTVSVTNSMWGDPFGGMWNSLMGCDYTHSRLWTMPGGQGVQWNSSLSGDSPASTSMTKTPAVGMVTMATIDGKPFLDGGAIPFDGSAPVTVTWKAVPNAASYSVRVRHLIVNGTRAQAELPIQIATAGTSVQIPASSLVKGDFYHVDITSRFTVDATAYAKGQIRRSSFPNGFGDVFSGMYKFSSSCGDHNVDAGEGEQCDDGGESATCDPDCSMALCGDGYVNKTAGEACDDMTDSPFCDLDCTLPKCGDGHLNQAAGEQCDDGNTTSGDGCSATCQIE